MRIEKGMLIETNYSGPYRITEVKRGCTCPTYPDSMDMADPPPQPPHLHLATTRPDGTGRFGLNHFSEETSLSLQKTYCGGKAVLDFDRVIIMDQDGPVQQTMF